MTGDYAIVLRPLPIEEGGGWHAVVPDLPGCQSDGDTREEALSNAVLAIGEWLDVQEERGVTPPSPGTADLRARQRRDEFRQALDDLVREYERVIRDIKVMTEAIAERDGHIARLERKHQELLLLLREDATRASAPGMRFEGKPIQSSGTKH